MIKLLRVALPFGILAAGLFLTSQLSVAKPEYAKKEKKGCTTCHVMQGKKELNKVGECYKDAKSLDGCDKKQ